MSKAVMLSIRPKWCKKIVNGEKTIEVRKTRPNIATPFKCYIYCTMDHPYISVSCMELDKLNYRTNTVAFPRMRGGDPLKRGFDVGLCCFSPHARG